MSEGAPAIDRLEPSRRLVWLALAPLPLAVAAPWLPPAGPVAVALAALVLLAAALEAALLRRAALPQLSRSLPPALSIGEWAEERIELRATGPGLSLGLAADRPEGIEREDGALRLTLDEGARVALPVRLRPTRRGPLQLAHLDLAVDGRLGLLRRVLRLPCAAESKVYPNFHAVARYALLSAERRSGQLGVHQQRRRGEGLEFFQLREYRAGDSLRQVDWKAAARRGQLISREYREEQNQQLIFLLDCGRRMHSKDGDLSHFDQVLNAVLLLTWSALRQGDAVGLQTFSGPDRHLPPRRGGNAQNDVMNTIWDLQTTEAPSDYAEAAVRLATRQRRRALVVLLTNLRDDDAADIPAALARLRKTHLVLVASLREPALDAALDGPVDGLEGALRVAAAHHTNEERRRAHELLAAQGVRTLDVSPAQLPAALISAYTDIKRAGLL